MEGMSYKGYGEIEPPTEPSEKNGYLDMDDGELTDEAFNQLANYSYEELCELLPNNRQTYYNDIMEELRGEAIEEAKDMLLRGLSL